LDATEKLLKELSEAPGVSGFEVEIRKALRRHLEPLAAIEGDRLGSLIARKEGSSAAPKVMIAAHMDEIGFMVKQITDEGFIRFLPLGGWWDQVILAQRMIVKTSQGDVVGITGAKPPHLLPQEERSKVVKKKDMYLDVGATSADEVRELGIRLGDPIIPVSAFTIMGSEKTYMGKALDDRLGCALLVQLLQALADGSHPNTIYASATVQEEVGLRGAKTAGFTVTPDVALILESDIAGDVPGITAEESNIKLGKGPSILLYDAGMIPNLKLRDLAIEVAEKENVPLQFSAMERGRTDGGMIHLESGGVPSLVVAVPVRHIHSHTGILHREDYDGALKLLVSLVQRLDADMVAGLTS